MGNNKKITADGKAIIMTPLLFISIVTLVLVLLIYWIMKNLEKRPDTPIKHKKRLSRRKFEAAQELFKFKEPDITARTGLFLEVKPHKAAVNWDISSKDWQSNLQRLNLSDDMGQKIIRFFSSDGSYIDMEINSLSGSREFGTGSFQTLYAVLGVKVNQEFFPFFLFQQ